MKKMTNNIYDTIAFRHLVESLGYLRPESQVEVIITRLKTTVPLLDSMYSLLVKSPSDQVVLGEIVPRKNIKDACASLEEILAEKQVNVVRVVFDKTY